MTTAVETTVETMVDDLFARAADLSADPYIREALAKLIVRQTVHRAVEVLDINVHDLADHLDTMADVIKDQNYGKPSPA